MLFFNGDTPPRKFPHKKIGGSKSPFFLRENSDSAVVWRPLHGNKEEFYEN